jgi:uncharacterized protein
MTLSRRDVLAITGLGVVGAALAGPLGSEAFGSERPLSGIGRSGWGPLRHAGPDLKLPRGFSYRTFGEVGGLMSDGLPTPGCHDGQGLFKAGAHRFRLLRNHEIDLDIPGATQKALTSQLAYDRAAPAGVTSSLYDLRHHRLLESFLVLNGTLSNCSGSRTPWGTWLSCEETTDGTGAGYEKPHGYVFEVPSGARGLVEPVPLKAMGRFEHETAPVDPRTGIVYMTEDNGDPGDGFYRFVPHHPRKLAKGGSLQMLAVTGDKHYDTAKGQRVGEVLRTHWVDVKHPDPSDAEEFPGAVYVQGRARGGARFEGLEGSSWSHGGVTFVASEAGDHGQGQVWRYVPTSHDTGTLTLLYESRSAGTLNQPDSITVTDDGRVVMAEDGDGEDSDGGSNYIRVLTRSGRIADLAKIIRPLDLHHWDREDFPHPGAYGVSEASGPNFTPDGKHLFVNIQYPGLTAVISGPF